MFKGHTATSQHPRSEVAHGSTIGLAPFLSMTLCLCKGRFLMTAMIKTK